MSNIISCSKVIVHRQSSKAYRIQGGTGGKAYISIMFCASATGVLLPPFVINKSKRLFQEWCVKGPPSTGFENSDNGRMNQRLFCHDTIINSSPLDSQESLKAITNALQAVFPTPSKETSNKPAKPTVLDRNYGHIITEKHVIEQLEERKNKQNSKRSRSTSQKLNGTKRRKK
ncbi:unnamed protein product [Rotaria sp. Silwood2]|nr:unnamed protein product [Rotaria sp. Silwood2]CAF3394174.1 unnamed protein product [Rotaria sp. Silwood2]